MVGAAALIREHHAGVLTNKQRAIVADLRRRRVRIAGMHLQMLRRHMVSKRNQLRFIFTEHNLTLPAPRLPAVAAVGRLAS